MRRLSLLDPIEHRDRSISTGNLGNILPMDLPGIIIRAHSSCMFPSDTRYWVSVLKRRTMTGLSIHFITEDLAWPRRAHSRPVSQELKRNFGVADDDYSLSQNCD